MSITVTKFVTYANSLTRYAQTKQRIIYKNAANVLNQFRQSIVSNGGYPLYTQRIYTDAKYGR